MKLSDAPQPVPTDAISYRNMALLKYFEGEVTLITRYGVSILVLNGLQRLTRGCEAEGRWSTSPEMLAIVSCG